MVLVCFSKNMVFCMVLLCFLLKHSKTIGKTPALNMVTSLGFIAGNCKSIFESCDQWKNMKCSKFLNSVIIVCPYSHTMITELTNFTICFIYLFVLQEHNLCLALGFTYSIKEFPLQQHNLCLALGFTYSIKDFPS